MKRACTVRPLALLVVLLLLFAWGAGGCDRAKAPAGVGEAVTPAPWDLATPESAVGSYLEWVSFAYRMADSDIPTATMTPEEAVRVDSYIQLNRMEGKGIEQSLDSFEVTSVLEEPASAILTARESWRYRYFSLETLAYLTGEYAASYDTTYTLVPGPDGWLVDTVEATPDAEVK